VTGSALVAQIALNGLMSASIYILVAIGLTLVLSMTGIVQLAHGEIYMLGAYGTYYFCTVLGLHYLLALLISVLIVGLAGIPLEKIFFRPFRGQDFMPSVIIAVAIMIMLQTTAIVSFGSSIKVVTTPFRGVVTVAGAAVSWERLLVIAISAVFVGGLFLLLHRTKMGSYALMKGIAVTSRYRAHFLEYSKVRNCRAIRNGWTLWGSTGCTDGRPA